MTLITHLKRLWGIRHIRAAKDRMTGKSIEAQLARLEFYSYALMMLCMALGMIIGATIVAEYVR